MVINLYNWYLILNNNSLDIINTYAKTYVSEFNYTNKHITQYINEDALEFEEVEEGDFK